MYTYIYTNTYYILHIYTYIYIFVFLCIYKYKYTLVIYVLNLSLNKLEVFNEMVVLGDFNAKSKFWHINNSTNFKGSKIDFLTSRFGFHQIINKPIHILNNSSSCINLIFTTQPNLVMKSGVHSSLHAKCYYQLTCEIQFKCFLSTTV